MIIISDWIQVIFRWLHVLAGIVWIGHLYFFNFVNGFVAKLLDADTKKKVIPELMPRALFWFRWGAAWTWITGVTLLSVVYYHGKLMGFENGWTLGAIVMLILVFISPFIYDILAKKISDPKIFGAVGFALISAIVIAMIYWGGYGYRAYVIHTGALLGTIMAFNVWYRIWPSQQKIITAVKNGQAPDAALVTLATLRSRHNTYLSVPLLWTMINSHTAGVGASSFIILLVIILVGWHIVFQIYKKAAKVSGF